MISNLSVILPVINERLNLETLIPGIFSVCSDVGIDCEIIVVDDGSDDGTDKYIAKIQESDSRILRIDRSSQTKSLPDSLNCGIANASYEYVLWMDADGSMPTSAITRMIASFNGRQNQEKLIVVGSRFISGGGFKGSSETGRTGLLQARRNLKSTNDSFTAMILSRMLNQYLYLTLKRCCKDPATGFVLTRKKIVEENPLQGSYGDYCPRFLFISHQANFEILEVPYICLPRQFGESKTGSNLIQLVKRGFPYVLMPFKIRFVRAKDRYFNLRSS